VPELQAEFEACPRCGIDLVDVPAMRACTRCDGRWATEATLIRLATEMAATGPAGEPYLPFLRDERAALVCPTCGNSMTTYKLHAVEIDRCARHGIWFDVHELQQVLYATYDPPDPLR
jgi:Zn-finger nucleic acid-binding protein